MTTIALPQPTTIHLHGPLAEVFGAQVKLYISSAAEAVRALCSTKKGFRAHVSSEGASYALLIDQLNIPLEAINIHSGNTDIHIVPVVEGNKNEYAQIVLGAVLVWAAYTYGGPAAGKAMNALWSGVGAIGVSNVLGGVAQLISPGPLGDRPRERPENTPSELFNGPVNTVSQGHCIQLLYGEITDVGSAVVAAMLDTAQRSAVYASGDQLSGAPADSYVETESGLVRLGDIDSNTRIILYLGGGTVVDATTLGSPSRNPTAVSKSMSVVYRVSTATTTLIVSEQCTLAAGVKRVLPANIKVGDALTFAGVVTSVQRIGRRDVVAPHFTREGSSGDFHNIGYFIKINGVLVSAYVEVTQVDPTGPTI